MSLSYPLSINITNQQTNDPFGLYVDGRNKKKIRKEYYQTMEHDGRFYFQRCKYVGDIT